MHVMNPSTITPSELKCSLAEGACRLIDVREPVEHAEEHIAGAKLIPLGQLEKHAGHLPRHEPIVVMCRSGKRGGQAVEKLHALGFQNVRNLSGGILAWKTQGNAVAHGARTVLPLMQQVQIAAGSGIVTGVLLAKLVHPDWIYLSAFFGAGLMFAGATGWCGLAMLLSKMPWNRSSSTTCHA